MCSVEEIHMGLEDVMQVNNKRILILQTLTLKMSFMSLCGEQVQHNKTPNAFNSPVAVAARKSNLH